MANQRYSPEFKDEAVRQVVDRGYSVAEVAASARRTGSPGFMYPWLSSHGLQGMPDCKLSRHRVVLFRDIRVPASQLQALGR